ncbi:hypothetical protein [Paenibacillus lactis]|uniref:hypothetical protein n=1 Tax=Paenibacillus lactis TaxID=228574 RepID=UPI00367C1570
MSEFKYGNCGTVVVKQSFDVFRLDDFDELTDEKVTIEKGMLGEIVSMGWSSTDGFRHRYDIEMQINGEIEEISLYENEIEKYMDITPFPSDLEVVE